MVSQDPCINCFCHFCGSQLRFQISRVGETVNCFNCTMETVLFIPGLAGPYPEERYRVEAREMEWKKSDFGLRYLAGVVMSMTQRHLDWVRVEFILYSQQGLPVGSTSDCRTSFGPNDLWKFQAPVAQTEAVKASDPLISCEYGRVAGGKILQATRPATPAKLPASR
jgi:hypothetical protein